MKTRIFTILICVCLCAFVAAGAADKPIGPQPRINGNIEETGPTVSLGVDSNMPKENTVEAFMYFVPLIAPVDVETHISLNNNQKAKITSSKRQKDGNNFTAVCQFAMTGNGCFENRFEPSQIIRESRKDFKTGRPLKNIIDYITFKGSGKGSVHIEGTIKDGIEHVSSVKVVFNEDDCQSPVTVGLYTVPYVNSQYKYENKKNELIARVNSLTFKSGQAEPEMELELAAITKLGKSEGFCSRLKAKIANLLVPPLKVDPLGNEVMLDFGHALYSRQASFTFPKAEKLKTNKSKETIIAKADEKQFTTDTN